MPLKHFGINDYPNKYFSHQAINKVIDYCNELERRLAEVEKDKDSCKCGASSKTPHHPLCKHK